jgi:excisionase family DNA binding protein
MKIEYDKGVDALSIWFVDRPKSARMTTVAEGINLDFDKKGVLVAIEILDASRFGNRENLSQLAEPSYKMTLAEAAKESGLQSDTLRSQINKGRLKARKEGRDWKVELADLYNYLESQGRSKRKPGTRARPREQRGSVKRSASRLDF